MTYAEAMSACLGDRGWDVEIMPDGGISSHYPHDQASAYQSDLEQCLSETGFDETPPEFTAEQLHDLYGEFLEVADCIEEQGYDLGDRPSEGVFIDTYYGPDGWDPWGVLQGIASQQQYYDLLEVCPTPTI